MKQEESKTKYDIAQERFEEILGIIAKIASELEDDPLMKEYWKEFSNH